jgi:Holliday junction DNA helicase RuvA
MFDYISGKLAGLRGADVVIDAGGVGYRMSAPLSTVRALPDVGASLKLLTYYHVTERGQRLFGFMTAAERDIFLNLIGISGIGPQLALTVLSGVSASQFSEMLASENLEMLTTIPGIGKKTAARIIVELKSKLPQLTKSASELAVSEEAVLALQSLGYSQYDMKRVVEKLVSRLGSEHVSRLSVEEFLREALRD